MTSFATIDTLRKHADWLRATYDFGYMEAQAKLCEFAADELYRLSAPPSQGKVERVREIAHNIVSYCREHRSNTDVLTYSRDEAEEYVTAAITQALTESSGQLA